MDQSSGQYMLACYQVEATAQAALVAELKETENAMRDEGLITDSHVFRMRSKTNAEYVLAIFEWRDQASYASVMDNDRVQGHWAALKAMWKSGGFGVAGLPESDVPWALMDAISSSSRSSWISFRTGRTGLPDWCLRELSAVRLSPFGNGASDPPRSVGPSAEPDRPGWGNRCSLNASACSSARRTTFAGSSGCRR
jgi:hypothetical protein